MQATETLPLSASRHLRSPAQCLAKRILDVVVSSAAFVVVAPVLAAAGGAIRLTSPGPALYRWKVVGHHGRPFTGYKLRTMVADADRLKEQLLDRNEALGPMFKVRDDPRITPIGRQLRRFSLDELPQLWSVLKGDMSLVGPRPPLQSEWEHFTPWQKQKLAVKPGITCLWQITGRSTIRDFDEWVRLDLQYIETWSFWLDLKILAKTVPAVLRGQGAW